MRVALVFVLAGCATRAVPVRPVPVADPEALARADGLRRAGEWSEAKKSYESILRTDPGNVRAAVGLQRIAVARGFHLRARRKARAAGDGFLVGRLEPPGQRQREAYGAAAEPYRSMGLGAEAWAAGKLGTAEAYFERARDMEPGQIWARLALGRYRLARGDAGAARAEFEAALWLDPSNPVAAYGLSVLADRAGDLPAAYAWAERAYRHARGQEGFAGRLYEVARRYPEKRDEAARLLSEGKGEAPLYAWRLLDHTPARGPMSGLPPEIVAQSVQARERAELYFERARAAGATDLELVPRPPVPEGLQVFVAAFTRGVRARYRHYAATGEAETFLEFVDWARDLYTRSTGRALGPRGKPLEFAFVGTMMDAGEQSDEPLVRACAKEGYLLVLAQRSGGPPEAMLAAVDHREAGQSVASRGMELKREVVWLDRRHLSGYMEWGGGGDVAGLALHELILVDLEAVATWDGQLQRRVARMEPYRDAVLAQKALDDEPVTSIEDPAGVDRRLRLVAGKYSLAEEVHVHENAHLVDAALHLPVGDHLFRNIGLALTKGLSAERILSYLERNAQLAAIAEGPSARGALATCCAVIGGRGVHATGYTEIVQGIVDRIAREPERYPEIDPKRVIVQQLHRLGEEQVRALARDLMDDWGVSVGR